LFVIPAVYTFISGKHKTEEEEQKEEQAIGNEQKEEPNKQEATDNDQKV
jgi:hypothetical protein